jgi:hypothetical protein
MLEGDTARHGLAHAAFTLMQMHLREGRIRREPQAA